MKKKTTMMFVLCMWINATLPFFVQSVETMYQNIIQEIGERSKQDSFPYHWRVEDVIKNLVDRRYRMERAIIESYFPLEGCFDVIGCLRKIERFCFKIQIKKYDALILKLKAKCEAMSGKS